MYSCLTVTARDYISLACTWLVVVSSFICVRRVLISCSMDESAASILFFNSALVSRIISPSTAVSGAGDTGAIEDDNRRRGQLTGETDCVPWLETAICRRGDEEWGGGSGMSWSCVSLNQFSLVLVTGSANVMLLLVVACTHRVKP